MAYTSLQNKIQTKTCIALEKKLSINALTAKEVLTKSLV